MNVSKCDSVVGMKRKVGRGRQLMVAGLFAGLWGANHAVADTAVNYLATTYTATRSCEQLVSTGQPGWSAVTIDALERVKLLPADLLGLVTKPYDNARGRGGTRFHWPGDPATSNYQVRWIAIEQNERFAGVQISTHTATNAIEQWVFDRDCRLRDHRRIAYGDEYPLAVLIYPQSIQASDKPTANLLTIELLNPALPALSEIPAQTASPESTESPASSELINDASLPTVKPDTMGGTTRVRVALVDSGVNYTLPAINSRLGRDASGRLLGYDFWDMDPLPFDTQAARSPFHITRHGTRTASLLLHEAPFVELIAYRYPRPDMARMQALIEHAAALDISIVGLPLGGNKSEEWDAFEAAARTHPQILFIASAGNNGRNIDQQPVYPASLQLENLLVVTSADDFARPAEGVNWGRESVDYLLPAENRSVLDFNGRTIIASGSSYAVPRMVAMAARLQQNNPNWRAPELKAELARRYADGTQVRFVGGGYIADPLALMHSSVRQKTAADSGDSQKQSAVTLTHQRTIQLLQEVVLTEELSVPLDVFVLDNRWIRARIDAALRTMGSILAQCGLRFDSVSISRVAVPDYLKDLATGTARTLFDAVRRTGPTRRATVVFARDTQMQIAYDGEAFGRSNTRGRPWLQDSVWLTLPIEDTGIALAHELFHVLANSGAHSYQAGNLMQASTDSASSQLNPQQCNDVRSQAQRNNLAH